MLQDKNVPGKSGICAVPVALYVVNHAFHFRNLLISMFCDCLHYNHLLVKLIKLTHA